MEPDFHDWDSRPVVRFPSARRSFAVLGGVVTPWATTWTEVDDNDVFGTAPLLDRETWLSVFAGALTAAGPWPRPETSPGMLPDRKPFAPANPGRRPR